MTSLNPNFVQDNHSKSARGVLRGLHYQLPPYSQGKLVRVIQGDILDVAVDIRPSSDTFGMHVSHVLTAENKKQIWIPEGFAHGILTLSNTSECLYKVTNPYNSNYERCILWNDSSLDINWPKNLKIKLSLKDSLGMEFKNQPFF